MLKILSTFQGGGGGGGGRTGGVGAGGRNGGLRPRQVARVASNQSRRGGVRSFATRVARGVRRIGASVASRFG